MHIVLFKRNRLLPLLVVHILAAICILSVASADEGVVSEKVYASREEFQYAISPSGFWFNEAGQIKWYGESDYEPAVIVQDSGAVHIASSESGVFYLTEDGAGQCLNGVSSSGVYWVNGVRIQSDKELVQLECSANSGLYGLDSHGQISSIYDAEGELNVLSIANWQNAGVTAFSLWDRYMLTYKAGTGELALIDVAARTLSYPEAVVHNLSWVQVGEMSGSDAIVFGWTQTGELLRISMTDGSQTPVKTNLPKDCVGLRRNEENIYTLGNGYKTLYAVSINDLLGKEMATLTVVNSLGNSAQFEAAVQLFHETYPDVQVVSRWIDDPRIIATELMSGSEGIDVVGIQDSMMPTSVGQLAKSGVLMDLNQFEILTELKQCYRDIWGLVTIGDCWYAVPQEIEQHPWEVDDKLAEVLDWTIPEGRWSWDEFKLLAEKVIEYNETAEQHIYLLQEENFLLPYFFHEYQANHLDILGGHADYQSESYLELLRMWKWLNDHQLICDTNTAILPTKEKTSLFLSYRWCLPHLKQRHFILPPTETENAKYPAYVCTLSINANSPHIEEAVYFLACYLDPTVVSKGYYWNNGQWLNDLSLYNTSDNYSNVSTFNETLWNDMLTQSIPEMYIYDISPKQSNTLMPGLIDGSVSPEQFAAISQQLADMALGE